MWLDIGRVEDFVKAQDVRGTISRPRSRPSELLEATYQDAVIVPAGATCRQGLVRS